MSITGGDEVECWTVSGRWPRPDRADRDGAVRRACRTATSWSSCGCPWSETTHLVELRTNAPVVPAPRVTAGSGCTTAARSARARSPTARAPPGPRSPRSAAGVELVNLGLAGSALLDPFTARAMRDTPADLVSVKVGINLVNLDLMRRRAFGPAVHGFLDTIREGHPDVPLLVVSPLLCPIHEETPGPGTFDVDALADGEVRFRGDRRPGRGGGREAHAAGDP